MEKSFAPGVVQSTSFRSDRFQMLLAASHGAGTNSFMLYLRKYLDIACLAFNGLNPAGRVRFLQANPDRGKCIFLDSADYSADEYLDSLRPQTDGAFLLVHLERDPVERLCSVANTHIYWWATRAVGFSVNLPGETWLFKEGDVNRLLIKLLKHPTMFSTPSIVPKTRVWTDNYMLIDMEAVKPARIAATLDEISLRLGSRSLSMKACRINSSTSFYSRTNRFVRAIMPLNIIIDNITVSLRPCPYEMLEMYNFNDNDIAWQGDKETIRFEVGKFENPLAFIFVNKDLDAKLKSKVRNMLANDINQIRGYVNDIMTRHKFQELFTRDILINNNKLIGLCEWDSKLRINLINYLDRHISFMAKNDSGFLAKFWKGSAITLYRLLKLK